MRSLQLKEHHDTTWIKESQVCLTSFLFQFGTKKCIKIDTFPVIDFCRDGCVTWRFVTRDNIVTRGPLA